MYRKELVKSFIRHYLDVRRYVTGVATGLTIALVIGSASGFIWVAGWFLRWASSLNIRWIQIPEVSLDASIAIIISSLLVLMFPLTSRITSMLLRGGEGVESKPENNETQLTRALEALTEQLQAMQKQREGEVELDLERYKQEVMGHTGQQAAYPGFYRSVDFPQCRTFIREGQLFPPVSVRGMSDQSTMWVLENVTGNQSTFFDDLE